MQRVLGPGGIYEPLVVTPAIGVRMEPEARILPLDGSALPVRVTVHAQAAAEGTVELTLPAGWTVQPASAAFPSGRRRRHRAHPVLLSPPQHLRRPPTLIQAVVNSDGHTYHTGWQPVGYPGLRPYNLYRPAQLLTRKVDVKLAPGLRIGYIMGTGDQVPDAIEALGVTPHLLTAAEVASGDFSACNVIVVGIRAYSARPELSAAQPRLNEFVRQRRNAHRAVPERQLPRPGPAFAGPRRARCRRVRPRSSCSNPDNPLLTAPNAITTADFDGWVEERGHSFLESWDPAYTALTETADPGQDPQRGGLVVAHPGKGTYIYVCLRALSPASRAGPRRLSHPRQPAQRSRTTI